VQIGVLIGNDIFPDAIEYFLGQRGEMDSDEEDSEEDEDEDADEIDLEKPRAKRPKH
jgi:template-activating factor I